MNRRLSDKYNKCLIISGGEFSPMIPDFHDGSIAVISSGSVFCSDKTGAANAERLLTIACDKGYEYAEKMGIKPDVIIGDFDSASHAPDDVHSANGSASGECCPSAESCSTAEIRLSGECCSAAEKNSAGEECSAGECCVSPEIIKLPCEKDDTDTMSAVKYALGRGISEISIICALGNRLDHTFANLQTAGYIVSHGGKAVISGNQDRIYAFSNASARFERESGWSLSVFSLSDRCESVSISGAKYTLSDASVTNSFPIGVSNEWKDENACISVGNGILLVILSKLR